ncbi:hypothetical protein CBER1_04281 [Cercospora berteroae]|uniref:DUF3328 domain-containing protein n=1 Tax=Cercospora berteroae TaxID=357750 RepID=A0A2S6C6A6_9PEZI|nr:hypothetical protein CBER1_04281 [Cercospora berteroae]
MASKNNYLYQSVRNEPIQYSLRQARSNRWYKEWSFTILVSHIVAVVLWAVSIALMYQYATFRAQKAAKFCGQVTYSPAQEVVEYELRVFSQGSPAEHTDYWGPPNEENNRLWRELWNVGGGQGILREQALQLPNRTSTLPPKWPDLYYVDLDVFHQLHCLDHIRHAIANDSHHLHSAALLGEGHIYHCFEAVRESLMCHADVSPIVRQWSPLDKKEKIRGDVVHTCRNFWKIHVWGREHAVGAEWDDDHDHDDRETGERGIGLQV